MHAHDIVLPFWTLSYISAALWGISVDTVQISCRPSSTNICISPLFPPSRFGPFFTEEALPDLGWKLKLWSSPGAGKARSMGGLINQTQNCHQWGLWEVEHILSMWKGLASLFSLSCGASKKCASSGSLPGVRFLCSRESVKYFHVKWRTVGISRNLSFEVLLKFNKDQFILEREPLLPLLACLEGFRFSLQHYLILSSCRMPNSLLSFRLQCLTLSLSCVLLFIW